MENYSVISRNINTVLTHARFDRSSQSEICNLHSTMIRPRAWRAEVKSLGGLLKMVPSGLIRGAAQKVIEDVWNGVADQVKMGV